MMTAAEPQYQGHPVGTKSTPNQIVTCDIMSLMAQGCKCGWLAIEKQLDQQVKADADFLEELKRM